MRRRSLRAATVGVAVVVGVSGLSMPSSGAEPGAAPASVAPASVAPSSTVAPTTSTTVGTTTTTRNQTAIISVSPAPTTTTTAAAPAPAGAAGPAGAAAPADPAAAAPPPADPPTTRPTATLTLVPSATAPVPAGDIAPLPAAPVPTPSPGAALRVPPAPAPAVAPPAPRQVPQLLEVAAARRAEANGRVVQAQDAVVALEAELATGTGADSAARADVTTLGARLGQAQAELAQLEQLAAAPAPAAPADPARGTEATPHRSPLASVWQRAVSVGRALLPDPPAAAVVVPDGVRARTDALRAQADQRAVVADLAGRADAARQRAEVTAAALSATSAELDAARATLATARDALAAALADVTFGPAAAGASLGAGAEPSALARDTVPAPAMALYQGAATTCSGLSWTVLAAIGAVESAHGASTAPGVHEGTNVAGAMGPMQFLGTTWAAYGLDADADGVADPYDPADAVYSAAGYLCANGAGDPTRLAGAVWDYNHSDDYVRAVLDLATRYGGALVDTATAAGDLILNPNLTLSPQAAADLGAGVVDRRVVDALAALARGHRLAVSVIETGHDTYVKGTDRVSNHFYGRAVDIVAIDGAPVTAANDAALEVAVALLTAPASLRPDELGSPWPELGRFPGAFSDDDHLDHLHLGWRTAVATSPTTATGSQP